VDDQCSYTLVKRSIGFQCSGRKELLSSIKPAQQQT